MRKAPGRAKLARPIEVFLTEDLESNRRHIGLRPLAQTDGVMIRLFEAAEVQRVVSFFGDDESQRMDPECLGEREVSHMSVHVRHSHDVERRMEVWQPNWQRGSFYVPIRGT